MRIIQRDDQRKEKEKRKERGEEKDGVFLELSTGTKVGTKMVPR